MSLFGGVARALYGIVLFTGYLLGSRDLPTPQEPFTALKQAEEVAPSRTSITYITRLETRPQPTGL